MGLVKRNLKRHYLYCRGKGIFTALFSLKRSKMSKVSRKSTPESRLRNTPVDESIDAADGHSRQILIDGKSKERNLKAKCRTSTAEYLMKRQYVILKEEYYRVCEQEARLRNQIALLEAEIILMQKKTYHKCPADVRTINIDPITFRKVILKQHRSDVKDAIFTKSDDRFNRYGRCFVKRPKTDQGLIAPSNSTSSNAPRKIQNCFEEEKNIVDKYFYFNPPASVVASKLTCTSPDVEIVTRYRLPKLKL